MARMSREFSLVLLGAGLLTAGYFLWPEDDPVKIANDQDGAPWGGGSGGRSTARHVIIVPIRTGGVRASTVAPTSTVRGGFGRVGGGFGGG
jgi:hypothetical protein